MMLTSDRDGGCNKVAAEALGDLVDQIAGAGDGDKVSVEDVISAAGQRAYGPLLLVFGLVSLSPVGSIPGASVLLGTFIIILCVQVLLGRRTPWFPSRLLRISVDSDKAEAALTKTKPYLQKVDVLLKPRWPELVDGPARHLVAMVCIILACTMYPLALVPWGVAAPSFAIAMFGLGIVSRDGLVMMLGLTASLGSLGLVAYFVF